MYMELIILSILVGVAIITSGVVFGLYITTTSKERIELQKLLKAKDLPQYTVYGEKPEEETIEQDSNLIELENIDTVIQEAIDKNVKYDK